MIGRFCISAVLLLSISGCDSNDVAEQDFPHSRLWPLATLAQVKSPVVVPDSLNVVAYVVHKYSPSGSDNDQPNAFIQLAEIRNPEISSHYDTLKLHPNPQEIELNREYVFSIIINPNPGSPLGYRLELAGFDRNE